MRDRSFGKKKRLMISPDYQRNSVYKEKHDKFSIKIKQNLGIVKNLDFSKLPRNYTDFKLKLKKKDKADVVHSEKQDEDLDKEESRELTVIKDPLPSMASYYNEREKIKIKNKNLSEHFDKDKIPDRGIEFEDSEEKQNDELIRQKQERLSTIYGQEDFVESLQENSFNINDEDSDTVEKKIEFKVQKHDTPKSLEKKLKTQQTLTSNYSVSKASPILINKKQTKELSVFKNFSYLKKKGKSDLNDKINELKKSNSKLKADNSKAKSYVKLLDANIRINKRELDEVNEEVEILKFERINTTAYYTKACKKLKKLETNHKNLQNEFAKTSHRFSQIVDYIYRLNNQDHFSVLEDIISKKEREGLDDIYKRYEKLNTDMSRLIDVIYLSNCEEIKEEVGKIIKSNKKHK